MPLLATFLLVGVLAAWRAYIDALFAVAHLLFWFGFCVGVLDMWVFYRIIQQWQADPSQETLCATLFLYTLFAAPGVVFVSAAIHVMRDEHGVVQHSAILDTSWWTSLVCVALVVTHRILDTIVEGDAA